LPLGAANIGKKIYIALLFAIFAKSFLLLMALAFAQNLYHQLYRLILTFKV